MIAHGGTAGAVVETLLALLVVGVLAAAWLRERRSGEEPEPSGGARLRDDEPGS